MVERDRLGAIQWFFPANKNKVGGKKCQVALNTFGGKRRGHY
jgi:hypothetical protein